MLIEAFFIYIGIDFKAFYDIFVIKSMLCLKSIVYILK
jgi:hypothetical protein